jgi:hypothetical protein
MERKTQLEPLPTARKKKDLFIAIAGAKRKTPSLTDHPACNESTESHPTAIASASGRQKRRKVSEQTFYILRNQIQTGKKLNLSRPADDNNRDRG